MAGSGLGEVDQHPADGAGRRDRDDRRPAREQPEGDPRVRDVPDPQRSGNVDGVAEGQLADDDLLRELVGEEGGERDRDEPKPMKRTGRQRPLDHRDRQSAVRG
jgi:hypothetical protein